MNENNLIRDNFVNLLPFTKGIRNKFNVINDCYQVLVKFYEDYPLSLKYHQLKNRYSIGYDFLKTFSILPLTDDDISFALNTIYTEIGINHVIQNIANFSGTKIKVDETSSVDKILTITIIAESIFDLDLFETKFKDFLNDVLMFQNIDFIFDLIVLNVNMEYNKKLYNVVEYCNIIPCVTEEEYELEGLHI